MQDVTLGKVTMDKEVLMVVVNESFAFPDMNAGVFAYHGKIRADFTNGREISLLVSVYDANPLFG